MQELEPVFEKVARYFSLLSDSSRLKVIHAICNQELSVSEVMSQAAATSFIHIVMLAASQASHSMRKTGLRSGVSAEGVESAAVIEAQA